MYKNLQRSNYSYSPKLETTGIFFNSQMGKINSLTFVQKKSIRASLVAQWLRIRLPMQETRVRALVREDPTCCGATKPVRHNY